METKNNVKIHTTPRVIKNPFICDTSAGVRLSLDKDPRMNKHNSSQFVQEYKSENGNTHLISETNSNINYCFGVSPETEAERTSIDNMDYMIPAETLNKTSKVEHKDGLPLSFLQIETEEAGIEWYEKHYPKIPTDLLPIINGVNFAVFFPSGENFLSLLPIIARYHWGKPITKKSLKNEKKKIQKDLHKKGFHVEQKKISLTFD